MRGSLTPDVRDLLTGLAPASGAPCSRCGLGTLALANGRGRVDICAQCGTLDVHAQEGSESWNLRQQLDSMALSSRSRRSGSP